MAAEPEQAVALDEEDQAIADFTDDESTFSARSSIYNFPKQHGRSYHAYKDGSYHRPNDETEPARLDLFNAIFTLVNSGKLHQAPISPTETHRILDIGTGTGIWAIAMGDTYESSEILGIDLSPSMSTLIPPNVKFEITDAEDDWTFGEPFTFIHSRYMTGSIKNWPKLLTQTYTHLKPGGWAEFVDFNVGYYSQDGSFPDGSGWMRWWHGSVEAANKTGRTLHPGKYLEQWMKEAGFVNVQVMKSPLPVGTWPKDERLKEIGLLNRTQLLEGLAGMSYRLFIDVLGWSREDLEALLTEARQNIKDKNIHALMDLYTVWGQKPKT